LGNIGNVYTNLSQYQVAINYYEQALGIAQEIGSRYIEVINLGNLAVCRREIP